MSNVHYTHIKRVDNLHAPTVSDRDSYYFLFRTWANFNMFIYTVRGNAFSSILTFLFIKISSILESPVYCSVNLSILGTFNKYAKLPALKFYNLIR
jgi:hypothetical protein